MTAIARGRLARTGFADERDDLARSTSKFMPRTAATRSVSVGKVTVRSVTSSRLTCVASAAAGRSGSSASRRPSPTRLAHNTISTSTPAGNRNTHGNVVTDLVPSAISVPSDTSGGWMPKPRKLNPVSARIAMPTFSAVSMMRIDATFGRMWRTMIRQLRHAHIPCGRDEFAFPQAHRHAAHDAGADHPAEHGEQHDQPDDVPTALVRGVTIAIRMKLGTTSSRSTIHISVRSRQPPK